MCVCVHVCVYIMYVCMYMYEVKESESENHSVVSNFLQPHVLCSPWNSPDQNTGVDSLSLLQGFFPTQGSNPDLPHCRADFLPAEPQGKPEFQSKSHKLPRNQKAMKIFSFAIKKMIQPLHVNVVVKCLEFNFPSCTTQYIF